MIALTLALTIAAHVVEARTFASSSGTPVSSGGTYSQQDPKNTEGVIMACVIFGSIAALFTFVVIIRNCVERHNAVHAAPSA